MNGKLSEAEKNALRFYIGDVSGNDAVFGDPKAYVVLNSLFFPDISTETARANEGKYLNPAIIADIPQLISFFGDLFSAFSKSAIEEKILTYRVERLSDYQLIHRNSATVSMTSTSAAGFLNAYRDRRGIALMKFSIENTPYCIDVSKALPYYAKSDEAEILIAPFMELSVEEVRLNADELKITDCDGKPPQISCTVKPKGIRRYSGSIPELSADGSQAGQRIYTALNNHTQPEKSDIELYSQWKNDLRNVLHIMI